MFVFKCELILIILLLNFYLLNSSITILIYFNILYIISIIINAIYYYTFNTKTKIIDKKKYNLLNSEPDSELNNTAVDINTCSSDSELDYEFV